MGPDLPVNELNGIPVNPDDVHIVSTPEEFYQSLLDMSRDAKDRICISSLYLGDGSLEKELVDSIQKNLENNSSLDVTVLLDFLRGTRGVKQEKSSTTLLQNIADKSKIYLYHTPELSGVMKSFLPERTNEVIGLQHMKLYIFDDNVLISGANLSDSYFTNRQDRYVLFKNSKKLADFFASIVEAVGRCSFKLTGEGEIQLHEDCEFHPYAGHREHYVKMFKSRIMEVLSTLTSTNTTECDTVVYPLIQMGTYNIHQEYSLLKHIFALKKEGLSMYMASGYFNCISEYEKLMINEGTYSLDVLTASPKANGFYGAKGMSGYIPSMYSWVSTQFLEKIKNGGRTNISLHEYFRPEWTFHAKGLWLESPQFSATVIGSSNYGYRSVHRDLEAQVLLVTQNEALRKKLIEERECLFEYASVVDVAALRRTDHHIPSIVRVVSKIIRNFF